MLCLFKLWMSRNSIGQRNENHFHWNLQHSQAASELSSRVRTTLARFASSLRPPKFVQLASIYNPMGQLTCVHFQIVQSSLSQRSWILSASKMSFRNQNPINDRSLFGFCYRSFGDVNRASVPNVAWSFCSPQLGESICLSLVGRWLAYCHTCDHFYLFEPYWGGYNNDRFLWSAIFTLSKDVL